MRPNFAPALFLVSGSRPGAILSWSNACWETMGAVGIGASSIDDLATSASALSI